MSNEILFIATLINTFVCTLLCYRYFGRKGIYAWIAFASVVINIEVLNCVDLFGMSITLGNVLYGSSFLATDILSENYGGKESRKAVRMGIVCQVCFILLTQLSLQYTPNENDFIRGAYKEIFDYTPRICIASLVSFYVSNTLDTYLYDMIAKKTKVLWIRNNGSTMTSQLVDTILFTMLSFYGIFNADTIIELIITTYAIKMVVAALDTPFAYIAKKITQKKYEI